MNRNNRGFTLVELSIVLVILGLLVGGVLAGQSLIRAAELRAVTREFQGFQTALGSFRDKYFAVPGDMNNAVKYWGAQAGSATADGVDATCAALTTAATGIATCNGNGDGFISDPTTAVQPHEIFRSWHHLANAGLVEGSFTGVRGSGGATASLIGVNVPRSKLSAAGWFALGLGSYTNANHFQANYGNAILFGAAVTNTAPYNPAIKGEEAYNIDMKLDDGKPHLGRVLAYKYALNPNCVLASNDAYDLANTNVGCSLWFISGY